MRRLVFAILLFPSLALAQTPPSVKFAEIAPVERFGMMVEIDASESIGDDFCWTFDKSPSFIPIGKSAVFFPDKPGNYPFKFLAVGIVDGKAKFASKTIIIQVGGTTPPPSPPPSPPGPSPAPPAPPAPTPAPTPIPEPEDASLGLSGFLRDLISVQPWTDDQKRFGASILADCFEFSLTHADTYPDPTLFVSYTGIIIRDRMPPEHYAAWHPAIIDPLKAKLSELNRSGKIASTTAAQKPIWREIAKALRGVAK
jgi:hypothetical protein